jgi:hypothetical protein
MAGIVAPASAGITLAVAAEAAVSPDGGLAGSAADDEDGSEAAGAGGRGFTCTTGAPLSPASACGAAALPPSTAATLSAAVVGAGAGGGESLVEAAL